MKTEIYQVLAQGETQIFQKQDGSQLKKCPIHLKAMGGKYSDDYAAVLLGDDADRRLVCHLVAATLRFQTREHEGKRYQDIIVTDIKDLSNF